MSAEVRAVGQWLADQLAANQQGLRALSAPQLANSSIEAGTVQEFDSDGTLVSAVGSQFDGTHAAVTLAGPVPPEPTSPTLVPGAGQVQVRWNGLFADGALSPMDFSHVAVHASRTEMFTPDSTTQVATITGESGDSTTVMLDPGDWAVLLVAVSLAGKWSNPSDPAQVVVGDTPLSDLQDALVGVDTDLAAAQASANGKNTITNATVDAAAGTPGVTAGDRWQKWTTLAAGGKLLKAWRWDGTTWIAEIMDPSYLPLVDIGQGTFGTLDGARLQANSIAVQKLLVGSLDNNIADPTFTNAAGDWGTADSIYSFPATEGYNSGPAFKIAAGTGQNGRYSQFFPVSGSASYRITVWVKSNVAIPAGALGIYTRSSQVGAGGLITNQLKQSNGSAGNDAIAANTWTQLSAVGSFEPAAVAGSIGFYKQTSFTTGTVWFSMAFATRMADGLLAVDGVIDGKTVIGTLFKTTAAAGAVSAQMGPTVSNNPFQGDTKYPGVGFKKEGSTDVTAGMFSETGTDLTVTQGGSAGNSGNLAYLRLMNNQFIGYAWDALNLTGHSSMTIAAQLGALALSGNTVTINGVPTPTASHWKTTTTQSSVPSGSYWGPGQPAYIASETSDPGLVTWAANDILQFRDTGIYALSVAVRFSAAMGTSGTSPFVSIEIPNATSSQIAYAKGPILAGDTQGTASMPNIRLAAGSQIKFVVFQNSGAAQTAYWRINVTRVG